MGNRRHHNEVFHQADRTRQQCWHCNKTFARLETAKKHAQNVHGDTEPRPCSKTNNKEPTLDTRNPGTQTMDPPPEARPRTVHQIYVPVPNNETGHINKIKQKPGISSLDPYITVTLEEALMTVTDEKSTIGRLNQLQTLEDHELSPSSSCSTITQDDTENTDSVTVTTVYGIISAYKD